MACLQLAFKSYLLPLFGHLAFGKRKDRMLSCLSSFPAVDKVTQRKARIKLALFQNEAILPPVPETLHGERSLS